MQIDDTAFTIRSIEAGDVDDLARMFARLSRESIYFRFFSPLPRVPDTVLRRMAGVDHCRRDALVAFHGDESVAIASYDTLPNGTSREAEIAVVVDDAWQRRGVALQLMCHLAELALQRGYETFVARTLPNNRAALALVRKLSPHSTATFAGGEYEIRLSIKDVACGRRATGDFKRPAFAA